MKKIILSIWAFLSVFSTFAFEGEITLHYKGDASKKEDYTVTYHIASGKVRTDFYKADTKSTTIFLSTGGSNVQLYDLGSKGYITASIKDAPKVEEYKVQETSETKTISGQVCTKYIFQSFTNKSVECWIAKGADINWSTVPETLLMLPEVRILAKYDIKGAPLETKIIDGGNVASQSSVVSVNTKTQPAEIFAIPAGLPEAHLKGSAK